MTPYFGLLNVDKPAGCSSRDVVDRVERIVRPAKAGHAGTLDPLATGVLVICVGRATRLIQYIQRMRKTYRATFLLGRSSDTDDIEAEVVEVAGAPVPDRAAMDRVVPQFVGEISQRPPIHSAIKVAGRRAYHLARRGTAVELAARPVTIHSLRVARYAYPELELAVECGSGTYVRALGRDLAAALGTSAVMSALERTAIGGFRVEDAVPVELITAEWLPQQMRPALAAVPDLPRVVLTDLQLNEIRHGRPIARVDDRSMNSAGRQPQRELVEWASVDSAGELVAILREKNPGELWPVTNLVGI